MMKRREVVFRPVILILVLAFLLSLVGCQTGRKKPLSTEEQLDSMLYTFNDYAGFYDSGTKLVLKTTEGKYSIEIGQDLDNALEMLCEIYTANPDVSDEFDADKVRDDLKNKTTQTVTDYSNQRRDYYLYKLFLWCGRSSSENVVYVGSVEDEESEKKTLKDYRITNFQIVMEQYNAKYNGTTLGFKFKWQQ